jgi:hypothetical protein
MTATELPRVGEVTEAKREPDDLVMWSVTTIIDAAVAKGDALLNWAVGVTAERVADQLDHVRNRLDTEGRAAAVKYIKGLRWQLHGLVSDADLGTIAHGLFDQYALSGHRPEVDPELHPHFRSEGTLLHDDDMLNLGRMLDQFDRWLNEYQPTYNATEVVVYHPDQGYAGQADAFVTLDGVPLIADYKTSRKTYDWKGNVRTPYSEVGLQLAAYRHATDAAVFRARRYSNRSRRYYLLSQAERDAALPVPAVEGGIAIKITPEHLGVYPVKCGPDQFEVFKFCQEVARWSFNDASHVVGNPMPPLFPPAETDDPFRGLPT